MKKLFFIAVGVIIGLLVGWFLREMLEIDLVGDLLDRFID